MRKLIGLAVTALAAASLAAPAAADCLKLVPYC